MPAWLAACEKVAQESVYQSAPVGPELRPSRGCRVLREARQTFTSTRPAPSARLAPTIRTASTPGWTSSCAAEHEPARPGRTVNRSAQTNECRLRSRGRGSGGHAPACPLWVWSRLKAVGHGRRQEGAGAEGHDARRSCGDLQPASEGG